MTKPRIAVIGAGPWGKKIIGTLTRMASAQLVAVVSSNTGIQSQLPANCRIIADWRSLVDDKMADGVVIAAPPALHAEMAVSLIGAGRSVLIEKPMCLSAAEAERIVAIAEKAKSVVQVNHIDLQNAAWKALCGHLPAIGPIRTVTGVIGEFNDGPENRRPHWVYGPHFIACCVRLMGRPPEHVTARRVEKINHRGIELRAGKTAVEIEMRFESAGARIVLGDGFDEKVRTMTVSGEDGELTYDDTQSQKLFFSDRNRNRTALDCSGSSPLENALNRFVAAIQNGNPDCSDALLGRRVIEVLCRCDQDLSI